MITTNVISYTPSQLLVQYHQYPDPMLVILANQPGYFNCQYDQRPSGQTCPLASQLGNQKDNPNRQETRRRRKTTKEAQTKTHPDILLMNRLSS